MVNRRGSADAEDLPIPCPVEGGEMQRQMACRDNISWLEWLGIFVATILLDCTEFLLKDLMERCVLHRFAICVRKGNSSTSFPAHTSAFLHTATVLVKSEDQF